MVDVHRLTEVIAASRMVSHDISQLLGAESRALEAIQHATSSADRERALAAANEAGLAVDAAIRVLRALSAESANLLV